MKETDRRKAKDILHEHLAPDVSFSVADLSQEQCRACSFPQEHVAWAEQTQVLFPEEWQQVVGIPVMMMDGLIDSTIGLLN